MSPLAERIAVLETKVDAIHSDLTELKADVKGLRGDFRAGQGVIAFIQRIAPWAALIVSALVAVMR